MFDAVSPAPSTALDELLTGPVPVLVDFWAAWCGPCRQLAPVLDKIAAELDDQVHVVKVDVDAEQKLTARFAVTAVPTLILFAGGQAVWRSTGARPFPVLLHEITATLTHL